MLYKKGVTIFSPKFQKYIGKGLTKGTHDFRTSQLNSSPHSKILHNLNNIILNIVKTFKNLPITKKLHTLFYT